MSSTWNHLAARALRENAANLSMEPITGEDVVTSLEKSEGHSFTSVAITKKTSGRGSSFSRSAKRKAMPFALERSKKLAARWAPV